MRDIRTLLAEARRQLGLIEARLRGHEDDEGALGVGVRNRPTPPVLPGAIALPLPPRDGARMIPALTLRTVSLALGAVVLVISGLLAGCPLYRVYDREMTRRAEIAQAQSNRQIRTLEAQAQLDSAKHLAQAEVERAKGVAEANRIIGESLKGNEGYLRYLWIHNLETAQASGTQVIYVPTEANLPILEATRRPATATAP